jgi:hypothetical protein
MSSESAHMIARRAGRQQRGGFGTNARIVSE